jgi:hypothetical protein
VEPLVQIGRRPGAADAVSVTYFGGREMAFRYDHWGAAACTGNSFAFLPGRPYVVQIDLDRLFQRARVSLDGKPVLDCSTGIYAEAPQALTYGENTIGFNVVEPRFTGTIKPLGEPAVP